MILHFAVSKTDEILSLSTGDQKSYHCNPFAAFIWQLLTLWNVDKELVDSAQAKSLLLEFNRNPVTYFTPPLS